MKKTLFFAESAVDALSLAACSSSRNAVDETRGELMALDEANQFWWC